MGLPLKETLKKRWVQNTLLVLATAAAAYGMVAVDVMARAREAFRRGVQHERWHQDPGEKKAHFEKKFIREQKALEARRLKGDLTEEDYRQDLEVLSFDRDQALEESAVKYAYQWYKDTYELFSPPESRWVRRARFLAPAAKEKWRDELRAKNIPFEEYMLDLEAGEDADSLMVYSTRCRQEAGRCLDALKAQGVDARLYDAPAHGRLPQEGIKMIVPRDRFWDAHHILKEIVEK